MIQAVKFRLESMLIFGDVLMINSSLECLCVF